MTQDDQETCVAFHEAVNMTPDALEAFLGTEDSQRVGWKGADGKGEGESVGHAPGRRVVEITRTAKADLTADDYAHMRKVVGYAHAISPRVGPPRTRRTAIGVIL